MSQKNYQYHSRSPEDWEKADQSKKKPDRKKPNRRRMILFFNFVIILIIVIVYISNQNGHMVKSQSLQTIDNYQIYMYSSKSAYNSGEPMNFDVYVTNLSNTSRDFSIYSFNVNISSESSPAVYNFNFNKVLNSKIEPKGRLLLFSLGREINLQNLPAGKYEANVLMNFDGKAVRISKSFTYSSRVNASLESGQDFLVPGQSATFSLFVTNNTPEPLDFETKAVSFSLLNSDSKELLKKTFDIPSQVDLAPGQSEKVYSYKAAPMEKPGSYFMVSKVNGTKDLSATSSVLVINPSLISDINDLKLNSDIPLSYGVNQPIDFSLSLVNTYLREKYVVLKSLTVTLDHDNVELYRFSSVTPRNVIIPPGGSRLLLDSKSWKQLTLPSTGTYTFDAIADIGGKYLEYRQNIESF